MLVGAGVGADELAPILGGNAAAFYGFDVERLAPLVDQIGPSADLGAGSDT